MNRLISCTLIVLALACFDQALNDGRACAAVVGAVTR